MVALDCASATLAPEILPKAICTDVRNCHDSTCAVYYDAFLLVCTYHGENAVAKPTTCSAAKYDNVATQIEEYASTATSKSKSHIFFITILINYIFFSR